MTENLQKAFPVRSANRSGYNGRRYFIGLVSLLSAISVGTLHQQEAFAEKAHIRAVKRTLAKSCPGGIKRVPFGFLWKPSSDVPGSRGGKPVVLLTGRNRTSTRSLSIFSGNGNSICSFSFKSPDTPGINGGADHYYSGWSGGCGKTARQIKGAASGSTGSVYVSSTGRSCIGPITPERRTGGI